MKKCHIEHLKLCCWTQCCPQQVFRDGEGKFVLFGFLFHFFLLLGFLGFASFHISRYTHAKIYVAFREENIFSGLSNKLLEIGLVAPYILNFPIILT